MGQRTNVDQLWTNQLKLHGYELIKYSHLSSPVHVFIPQSFVYNPLNLKRMKRKHTYCSEKKTSTTIEAQFLRIAFSGSDFVMKFTTHYFQPFFGTEENDFRSGRRNISDQNGSYQDDHIRQNAFPRC